MGGGQQYGEATLEQLDADVRRVARDYVHVPPLRLFGEMLRVRNRVCRLLAGRQKPTATAHLHLLAGILCTAAGPRTCRSRTTTSLSHLTENLAAEAIRLTTADVQAITDLVPES
jgi:hypothetical protein